MSVKLLTEHTLEFLSLKEGCTGWSESKHIKMPHCWKSRITAHMKMNPTKYQTIKEGWNRGGVYAFNETRFLKH